MICIYNIGYVNIGTQSTSVCAKKNQEKSTILEMERNKNPYTYVTQFFIKNVHSKFYDIWQERVAVIVIQTHKQMKRRTLESKNRGASLCSDVNYLSILFFVFSVCPSSLTIIDLMYL